VTAHGGEIFLASVTCNRAGELAASKTTAGLVRAHLLARP